MSRAPSFVRGPQPAKRGRSSEWLVLAVLGLLLVAQLLLAEHARLAADAHWRPAMASVCNALGCTLPPWREPAAFTMLARDA